MPANEIKPVVCTLTPSAMEPRLAQIRSLTSRHLLSHRLEGSALHLIYEPVAAVELAEIVAMERECCAFLDFEIRAHPDRVELRIAGPSQAGTDTQWLFAQFLPEPQAPAAGAACACCKG